MKKLFDPGSALCYAILLSLSACADAPTSGLASAPLAGEKKCTVSEPVAGTMVQHRTCTATAVPASARDAGHDS